MEYFLCVRYVLNTLDRLSYLIHAILRGKYNFPIL